MHFENNVRDLSLEDLKEQWTLVWGQEPHKGIGRSMLVKSLQYKLWEQAGGGVPPDQKSRLEKLVRQYQRNPAGLDVQQNVLKPGTRLIRMHAGKQHIVLVRNDGFEYQGRTYKSLSKIANQITGSRWNGWVFFGLK